MLKPTATFFVYAEAPVGVTGGPIFHTAEDFSLYLLKERLISTVPWDDAGHYVRFSVTYTADASDEEYIMSDLVERMSSISWVWFNSAASTEYTPSRIAYKTWLSMISNCSGCSSTPVF